MDESGNNLVIRKWLVKIIAIYIYFLMGIKLLLSWYKNYKWPLFHFKANVEWGITVDRKVY